MALIQGVFLLVGGLNSGGIFVKARPIKFPVSHSPKPQKVTREGAKKKTHTHKGKNTPFHHKDAACS